MNSNSLSFFISILKDLGVIFASITAIYGINSWRRETKWKKKHDLAEATLVAFYDVQERLDSIRCPFANVNEGESRIKHENETANETEQLNRAYIAIERYEKNKEPFQKLWALRLSFKALFGKEFIEPFNEINKILREVLHSYRMYFQRVSSRNHQNYSDTQLERHIKYMDELEKIFWSDDDDKDPIKERVSKAIGDIENICFEILRK